MALDGATLLASLGFAQKKTRTGFAAVTVPAQTKFVKLTPAATVANKIFNQEYAIAALGTVTIDLSSFVDDVGDTVTPSKAMGILVIPTGAGSVCQVAAGTTNGLVWVADTVPAGGVFLHGEPVGVTIDATHKTIKFAETGNQPMTLDVMVLCLQ
ncbi:MAG: hypothetical protein LC745_01495 [Planctomycetia bacterium]|nr:hypothetical protein [Planctomycetia bacterium]